jgi:DNA-binding SARP family transcriptional activator
VSVLGDFAVTEGGVPAPLPSAGRRLLAALAVAGTALARPVLSGRLWPDSDSAQAAATLRAAVSRLPRPDGRRLVHSDLAGVALAPHVDIDLWRAERRLHHIHQVRPGQVGSDWCDADVELLSRDLLPDWDEEWLVVERERHRQVRLHALEAMSVGYRRAGQFGPALQAGLAAVAADPLRESAHRRVVEAHLAEANASEALRAYRHYRHVLWRELRMGPSPAMEALVTDLPTVVPRTRRSPEASVHPAEPRAATAPAVAVRARRVSRAGRP